MGCFFLLYKSPSPYFILNLQFTLDTFCKEPLCHNLMKEFIFVQHAAIIKVFGKNLSKLDHVFVQVAAIKGLFIHLD